MPNSKSPKREASPKKATADASSSPAAAAAAAGKKKKSVVFSDPSQNKTTFFDKKDAPKHLMFDDNAVDWEHEEEEQKERFLVSRQKHTALDPKDTGSKGNFQQAFNLFEIPTVLDTSKLNVTELRAELKARRLSTTGTKQHLAKRLEMYIAENEPHRMDKAVEDEEHIQEELHHDDDEADKNKQTAKKKGGSNDNKNKNKAKAAAPAPKGKTAASAAGKKKKKKGK